MTWKTFALQLVQQFCDQIGARTFQLGELYDFAAAPMLAFAPENHHRNDKLRQTLQFLRDDGLLSFVDGRGTYTLRGTPLLKGEIQSTAIPLIQNFQGSPQKREYFIEVYARNRGWAKQARDLYGTDCLCEGCANAFIKDNGKPYCEVHHIVPLCGEGEDAVWNLAILCAHHHRMAHFARKTERNALKNYLLDKTQLILSAPFQS